MSLIEINGDFGEGGGSIVRIGSGLALALDKPIRLFNIRANRKKPGLRMQHLKGIEALKKISDGRTSKINIGTTDLTFFPGKKRIDSINIEITTAGSIGLLTQTLYHALINAPNKEYKIRVKGGGTFGTHAPSPIFLNNVTFSILKKCGYYVNIDVENHGYYPKGGGAAKILIIPKENQNYSGFNVTERGSLREINVEIHVEQRLKRAQVAERISNKLRLLVLNYIESLKNNLKNNISHDIAVKIKYFYHNSLSPGVGVDMWLVFDSKPTELTDNYSSSTLNNVILGIPTILGKRGISSEKVALNVFDQFTHLMDSAATVDDYAADQIISFLHFSKEQSQFRVKNLSSHLKTNLELLKSFGFNRTKIYPDEKGYLIYISPI